jgi:hypothetical protein
LVGGVLIWLVTARSGPPISIGVQRYELWAGSRVFRASVGVTNNGLIPISYTAVVFDPKGWVRVELQNGLTTRDLGPLAMYGVTPKSVLGPGSNTTAWVLLPAGTLRWRVGYKVRMLSLRERVTERIPPAWRFSLRPLTAWLSNKSAEHEISSALFEAPCPKDPPRGGGGAPPSRN